MLGNHGERKPDVHNLYLLVATISSASPIFGTTQQHQRHHQRHQANDSTLSLHPYSFHSLKS
jgi:hypothetical protein